MGNLSQGEAIRLKKILIFAGTTEGRKLSEYLAEAEINHTICVATEYGAIVLRQHPLIKVERNGADWNINSIFEVEKRRYYGERKRHYLF